MNPDVESKAGPGVVALAILVESGLIALALVLGWASGVAPFDSLSWSATGAALGVAATAPMLLLLWLIVCSRWRPLRKFWESSLALLGPLFGGARLWQVGVVAALAGFAEELLFRGVLQPVALRWFAGVSGDATWSSPAAIVLVSLVFGALHAVSALYFLLAFAISGYLGVLTLMSGGVLPAVVAHGVYDFIALMVLQRAWHQRASRGVLAEGDSGDC